MAEYNGWSNYETWCVSLWLSNEEGTYNATREMALHQSEQDEDADYSAVGRLADELQEYVEQFPEVEAVQSQASFVSDLFGAAFSEVDWREIADNLLAEFRGQ